MHYSSATLQHFFYVELLLFLPSQACLLLSLVGRYSAGQQLSLDMLCRLNTAHDEIIEVLLSQHQVTPALR